MKDQVISASIPCDSCGGSISISDDQLTEGMRIVCPLCGESNVFDREKVKDIQDDFALIEGWIAEEERKQGH